MGEGLRFWIKLIKSTPGSNPERPRVVSVNCCDPVITQAARISGIVAIMMPTPSLAIKSIEPTSTGNVTGDLFVCSAFYDELLDSDTSSK